MKFKISSKLEDIIVIPVFKGTDKVSFFNKKNIDLKKNISKSLKMFSFFKGKKGQLLFLNIENQKVLLIGLDKNYSIEDIRVAFSSVFKALKSRYEFKVLIDICCDKSDIVRAIIDGMSLSDYNFDRYKKKNEDDNLTDEKKEFLISLDVDSRFEKLIRETSIINKNTFLVRDLVNDNSDIVTPIKFEQISRKLAKQSKLKLKVLNEKQIEKEGLGLLKAVGQGSINPARLIVLEYKGNPKSSERIALIGKGITFDTGGINLKPTGYVEDMKTDMAGAATVFGVFKSCVELRVPKNLILVISAAENALSSSAYKPGDIMIGYDGQSVEIGNTDAEGRLVLADAISYVQKNYKPTKIIDMATLTGACPVALGPTMIAILGNDEKMENDIYKIGEGIGEKGWRLPIYDEHRDLLKSDFADMKNIGGKYGGTITAAAFLEKFVDKDIKWVHLDIAGAARGRGAKAYVPDMGTGRGVRLLVDYFMNDK